MTKSSQQRRLAELEMQSNRNAFPYIIFGLNFVEPNGQFGGKRRESNYAQENDGREWHRLQDETPEDFEKRVRTILGEERTGHGALVIFDSTELNISCESAV